MGQWLRRYASGYEVAKQGHRDRHRRGNEPSWTGYDPAWTGYERALKGYEPPSKGNEFSVDEL